jgi:hypothetical protein
MNQNKVFISDVLSTLSGVLVVILPWLVGYKVLITPEIDATTKAVVAGSLFGSSMAGAIIGKQQPTALKDLYLKSTTESDT